jgi:hypothetical protein
VFNPWQRQLIDSYPDTDGNFPTSKNYRGNTNDLGSTTEPQNKRESETEQNGFPSREEFYSKPDDDHIGFPLVTMLHVQN